MDRPDQRCDERPEEGLVISPASNRRRILFSERTLRGVYFERRVEARQRLCRTSQISQRDAPIVERGNAIGSDGERLLVTRESLARPPVRHASREYPRA